VTDTSQIQQCPYGTEMELRYASEKYAVLKAHL